LEQQLSLEEKHKWVTNIPGYDFELSTRKETIILWQIPFQVKKKKNKVGQYVLFLFWNMIGWKKHG